MSEDIKCNHGNVPFEFEKKAILGKNKDYFLWNGLYIKDYLIIN